MSCSECEKNKKNLYQQAINITKGFTNVVIGKNVEVSDPRLKICYSCPYNTTILSLAEKKASKCEICKCIVEAKTTVEEEKCPKDKW